MGQREKMALMIITVTAVWLPTDSELSLSLCECIKSIDSAVPVELGGSEDGRSFLPLGPTLVIVFKP